MSQVLPNTAANRARGVVGCRQTSSGITCPGGGGGGGSSYGGGYNANTMMLGIMGNAMNSFMQGYQRGLAIRRKKEQGNRYNDQGLAYERQKNWSMAAGAYRNALRYWQHPTIVSNLRRVEDELSGAAERRRKAERRRRAEWAAKQKRLKGMIGKLADRLTQGGTLGSLPDADMAFVGPGGTSFFGTGGAAEGELKNKTPSDENGLSFMDPKDEFFSKGTKYSATPDLRDTASDQLAVNKEHAETGKATSLGDGLDFYQPNDQVKTAGQAGIAPGVPLGVKPKKLGPAPSRKAALLLDSLEHGGRDWEESRKYLKSFIKANPMDADARAALKDLNEAEASAKRQDHLKTPQAHLADVRQEIETEKQFKPGKDDARGLLDEVAGPSQTAVETVERLMVEKAANDKGNYDKFGWPIERLSKEQNADPIYQHKMLTAEGLLSDKQGHHVRARHYFERALALNSKDVNVKAALENTRKNLNVEAEKLLAQGQLAGSDGDALKEMAFYKRALIRKPNDPAIKNLIAETQDALRNEGGDLILAGTKMYQSGDNWRALVYFKQARLRLPNSPRLDAVIKKTEARINQKNNAKPKN